MPPPAAPVGADERRPEGDAATGGGETKADEAAPAPALAAARLAVLTGPGARHDAIPTTASADALSPALYGGEVSYPSIGGAAESSQEEPGASAAPAAPAAAWVSPAAPGRMVRSNSSVKVAVEDLTESFEEAMRIASDVLFGVNRRRSGASGEDSGATGAGEEVGADPDALLVPEAGDVRMLGPSQWQSDGGGYFGEYDDLKCAVCNGGFGLLRRKHHCRNCGRLVCSKCTPVKWPRAMLSESFNEKNEKLMRVCTVCNTSLDYFRQALLDGDFQRTLSVFRKGFVRDLSHPWVIFPDKAYAVHCAASGGNMEIVRWLSETLGCSVEVKDGNGCTPLEVTANAMLVSPETDHLPLIRYLLTRGSDINEIRTLQTALGVLRAALKSQAPPGTGGGAGAAAAAAAGAGAGAGAESIVTGVALPLAPEAAVSAATGSSSFYPPPAGPPHLAPMEWAHSYAPPPPSLYPSAAAFGVVPGARDAPLAGFGAGAPMEVSGTGAPRALPPSYGGGAVAGTSTSAAGGAAAAASTTPTSSGAPTSSTGDPPPPAYPGPPVQPAVATLSAAGAGLASDEAVASPASAASAAHSNAGVPPPGYVPPAGSSMPSAPPAEDEECIICFERPVDCVLVPCGHCCVCLVCADLLADGSCPVCRRPIERVVRTFRS